MIELLDEMFGDGTSEVKKCKTNKRTYKKDRYWDKRAKMM